MLVKEVKAQELTKNSFKTYGQVIELPQRDPIVSLPTHSYWHSIGDIGSLGDEGVVGYLITKHRDFTFTQMERHTRTIEVFIPLEGCSIFPVAPPSDLNDPNAMPSPEDVTAFILDGKKGVILDEGTWHWAPFPLGIESTFALLLKKPTVEKDITIKDLEKEKGLLFKLVL